ncbi:MAG: glycoside hydrolase [Deltaproteobacteria bacterium]|nr:glycoside hydrolase [Deltaproteobacteria bacterium]
MFARARLASIVPTSRAVAALALALAACGGDPGGGDPLTISPTSAQVATCRTAAFTADPADLVSWSASVGTIADGLYAAPISVPDPAQATITATRDGASASATVDLATAFPGAIRDLAPGSAASTPNMIRAFAARGARAYALTQTTTAPYRVSLVRSNDGGVTWQAPTTVGEHGGPAYLVGTSLAIDPADPEVVHVLLYAGAGGEGVDSIAQLGLLEAGSLLVLATSTNGGASFTQRTLYSGGNGDVLLADLAAPTAGAVVIAAPTPWIDADTGAQGDELLIWSDAQRGAGFGALVDVGNGYQERAASPRVLRGGGGEYIETATGHYGASVAAGTAGDVCVAYARYQIDGTSEAHTLVCSHDGGATWAAPVTIASGLPTRLAEPRIAMSTDGQVVAAAWQTYASDVDELGTSAYAVSTDGGATFGAPHLLGAVIGGSGANLGVSDLQPSIDSEGVIWLARTLDRTTVQLDKSCDDGVTLSGAIFLDATGGAMVLPQVFESSAGVFAGGTRLDAQGHTSPAVVKLLDPA